MLTMSSLGRQYMDELPESLTISRFSVVVNDRRCVASLLGRKTRYKIAAK